MAFFALKRSFDLAGTSILFQEPIFSLKAIESIFLAFLVKFERYQQ